MVLALLPALLAADDGFVETFDDDPIVAGRWTVMPGEDGARFNYDGGTQTLTAQYDSGLPTARLVRPLRCGLNQNQIATFEIRLHTVTDENNIGSLPSDCIGCKDNPTQ